MTVRSAEFSMRPARPVISFRPPCFIKPTAAGDHPNMSASTSAPADLSPEMKAFIRTFDNYCQKVYMEGFLYKQTSTNEKVRCYAELAGSVLSVWDAQVQSPRILPQYYHMSDATADGHGSKNIVTIHMSNGSRQLVLEAQDEPTMLRWVGAIRLSCFENKRLHMLFSLRLLLQNLDPQADMSGAARWESACQVRLPGRQDWQKFHAVVNHVHTTTKKALFKVSEGSSSSKQRHNNKVPQLCLMESKKSKTPAVIVSEITSAYTLYPESPQLLDKGLMMRVDGTVLVKGKDQAGHLLIMTENQHHLCTGLFAIYDAYKLYGRPHTLLTDASDEMALNYGCTGSPRLFLETEDLTAAGMPAMPMSSEDIDRTCLDALHRKLSEPFRSNGMRANSLPLITVAACDNDDDGDEGQHSILDVATLGSVPLRQRSVSVQEEYHMFSRQVADSSDEEDEDDEDEEQEEEEDPDSDDEPIGKAKASATATPNNKSTSSLIPDFDFGNGFDVGSSSPRPITTTLSTDATQSFSALSPSPSSSSPHPQSHNHTHNHHHQPQQQEDHSKQASSASSLFGDFSLSMDFGTYMGSGPHGKSGPTAAGAGVAGVAGVAGTAGTTTAVVDRKYSLPANVKLSERESVDRQSSSGADSSSSSRRGGNGGNGRRSSWDHWPLDDGDDEHSHRPSSSRHLYEDMENENDGYELGPMIPSLSDHFAPQNSLLDTYLGDQLTAKEQIQYCRATGQPLIQVEHSSRPRIPEGGFVGMISRREKDRKEGNNLRVSERVLQHHADLEREKERRLFEQRQQQWTAHHPQMMMFGTPAPPPMMYHPSAPMHPYMPMPSPPPPLTPTSPLSPGPHYMVPPGYMLGTPPHQQFVQSPVHQQQLGLRPVMMNGPRSPSISSPASSSRRPSRAMLDDLDDDTPVINSRYHNTRPALVRKD